MVRRMEAHLESANKVLEEAILRQIPKRILKGCKGIAIINSAEFAFGVTGGGGDGVLVKHNAEDGSWGAPAAIHMDNVGVGAELGIANKYVLLVPMTDEALKKLTENKKLQLGFEIGFSFGYGSEVEASTVAGSPLYVYTFEKGLMGKAGIQGTWIVHQNDLNKEFYGIEKDPAEIVLEPGAVTLPEGNKDLDEFFKKLGTIGTH